jgi:hypothetical protein
MSTFRSIVLDLISLNDSVSLDTDLQVNERKTPNPYSRSASPIIGRTSVSPIIITGVIGGNEYSKVPPIPESSKMLLSVTPTTLSPAITPEPEMSAYGTAKTKYIVLKKIESCFQESEDSECYRRFLNAWSGTRACNIQHVYLYISQEWVRAGGKTAYSMRIDRMYDNIVKNLQAWLDRAVQDGYVGKIDIH